MVTHYMNIDPQSNLCLKTIPKIGEKLYHVIPPVGQTAHERKLRPFLSLLQTLSQ